MNDELYKKHTLFIYFIIFFFGVYEYKYKKFTVFHNYLIQFYRQKNECVSSFDPSLFFSFLFLIILFYYKRTKT